MNKLFILPIRNSNLILYRVRYKCRFSSTTTLTYQSIFLDNKEKFKMAHNPRVVIIGSGVAGYAAASKLLEHGYSNITILEAENRMGGRINSVPFGTGMIDLGAQWCHGEKDNVVYSLVKDLNMLEHSQCDFQNFTFLDSSGNFADTELSRTLINLLFELSGDTEQLKIFDGSFGDYITKRYEEMLNSEYPEVDRVFAEQILNWFHKLENNLNASSNWFEISAKRFADYVECEGDQTLNWKDKGYKILFSVLKKEIPDFSKKLPVDEKIVLNKEVTKIIWDNPNKQQKELAVECADGSQYKADHVILAVSLGVLKHLHNSLFVPEIPLYKKNAIQGLSFGCMNKIILKFPIQWWSADSCGFSLLWRDEDRDKIITDFPEGPSKDGKSWLTAFFGFYPVDYNPNILLGFVNGEFCAQIESLSDDLVIRGCMYLLRKFVGKHHDIPMPDSVLRSSWATNKHFRGSYSFQSLETDRLNTSASELAKPLGDNALLFAGEATHPYFYSTVHGAIETGFREAQRIISHYNVNTPSQVLKCNVAIVGAGIAGLAAAVTLAQAGCTDILLLEAQEKPGGRIRTVEVADGYVDLGAQWLHGDQNSLWKISHDNDLISSRTVYEGRGVFLREDGYKFNDFLVEKVNFVIGRILEDCEEFVDSTDVPESVGKYLEDKFGEYLKTNSVSEEEIRLYLELYDWNVRFQVIDNCCDNLYNVSAKFWGRYFCPTSGGQAHINYSKGHASVIEVLTKKLPENILRTNYPVSNINWGMNGNAVNLTCQNATVIETDAVIVTSSLGVLKNRASKLFTPPLPLDMTEIIDAMGFASIGKIFLLFEEKWWNEEEGFQLVWNFDHRYEDDWCRYLSGFDPVLDQPCMLLGWIGGRGAELVESVNEEEIGRKCTELLRKFTGNINISNPVHVIRSTWSTNPWILGGYSHTTPKCDNRTLLPEVLQKPLRDRQHVARVLLAGEHTHAEHFSTTHGAYETGMRQAQILLDEGVAFSSSNIYNTCTR